MRKHTDKNSEHATGDTFIREKTGSATMINLDGQWEHDFTDDPTPTDARPPRAGGPSDKDRR